MPKFWSQTATNVVVSQVLPRPPRHAGPRAQRPPAHRPGRRTPSPRWGRDGGYFATEEDAQTFHAELTHILLYQYACFNSPVWFNVGIEEKPQCSACFINSVEDTMDSILTLAKTEGMLFKYGSGTGSNLSKLRSSREPLAGGGTASGPVSFMKGFDAFAGVIKSGGKTRRAAKMVILDVDHPDIVDFISCKEIEERKAWALIDAGYEGGFNVPGGAYDSIAYQNANHSVRVTDDFMNAVARRRRLARPGRASAAQPMGTYKARDLMKTIADAAWVCGDPGMQYDTTINDWHTCANTARINASNPCSEYMFLDDTACNLASLNLMRFYDADTGFDVESFRHACEVVISAHGDHRRQRQLPDPEDRRELAQVPAARDRLRQPRRPADGARPPLRLRRRPRLRGGDHRADVRRLLRAVGAHRRGHGAVRRVRGQPRADAAGDAQAPRRGQADRRRPRAAGSAPGRQAVVGRGGRARRASTACATARSRCSPPPARSPS